MVVLLAEAAVVAVNKEANPRVVNLEAAQELFQILLEAETEARFASFTPAQLVHSQVQTQVIYEQTVPRWFYNQISSSTYI